MKPVIAGIGIESAPFRYKQSEILHFMTEYHQADPKLRTKLEKIYHNSGIQYRHSVLEDFSLTPADSAVFGHNGRPALDIKERMRLFEEKALPMTLAASRKALQNSQVLNKEVTHLITVSCTGMSAPGLESKLLTGLHLNPDTERLSICFMGCYAMINALKTANHIVRSQTDAKVLIAGVELCTIHLNDTLNTGRLVSHALFSDGAASALVTAQKSSDQNLPKLEAFESMLIPEGDKQMTWQLSSLGFEMQLAREVPVSLQNYLPGVRNKLLEKCQFNKPNTLAELQHVNGKYIYYNDNNHFREMYAIHPGGRAILDACKKSLNLEKDQLKYSYEILNDYGNMSSVTLLFVLDKLLRSEEMLSAVQSGEIPQIFACAFGPGLTIESAMLTFPR